MFSKKYFLLLSIFFVFKNINSEEISDEKISISIDNQNQKHEKIKCQFLTLTDSETIEKLSKIIKFDLEFTDQLEIDLKKSDKEQESKIEKKFFDKGTSLCIYLRKINSSKINIKLKDTYNASTLFEKDFNYNKHNLVIDGHKISNELLPFLTGENGICMLNLAYTKSLSPKHKVICVSDYSCKIERTVVPTKTLNVAPCWHSKSPTLFYSQFTNSNNRLMSIDLKTKKNKIVCSFEGLNMQPTFSQDGCIAVLCLSGGKNSELYMYDQKLCNKSKERVYIQLTKNGGNNSSPILLENGNIVFCSDYETKNPQIYYLDRKNNKTIRLTNGIGYCAAPSYCPKKNSLVYSRVEKGIFQIYNLSLNNINNIKERQLTFGPGDKHEPCISECGRFVAFAYECEDKHKNKTSQIAVLNTNSNNIHILTTGKEAKGYPKWGKEII